MKENMIMNMATVKTSKWLLAMRRFRSRRHVGGVLVAVCLAVVGTARSDCVVYDSGHASANAESSDTTLTVNGAWDVSQFGEIAVELEHGLAQYAVGHFCPIAHYKIRMASANGGVYEVLVKVSTNETQFVRPIPPAKLANWGEIEPLLVRMRTEGFRHLIWPCEYWFWGPSGRILKWTLDAHNVVSISVDCSFGYVKRLPPVRRIVLRGTANRVVSPPAFAKMNAEEFFPFIDRYGQFKHREWPGKIHCDADLKRAAAHEEADLAAHPGPRDWNKWGGWAKGPRYDATGQFRVQKINGKWWFIDPDGCLWWSHGPVRVSTGCSLTGIAGRDGWFEWLPERGSPFAEFYKADDNLMWPYYEKHGVTNVFDFVSANFFRKYGPDWRNAWRDMAHRRLRSWGANTIANGSDPKVTGMHRTPYCDRIDIKAPPIVGTIRHSGWWPFRDPFDPRFRICVREQLAEHRTELEDPWCFGFFVDNEHSTAQRPCLGRWTLDSPDEQPAKVEFLRRLRAKYGRVPEKVGDDDCGDFSVALLEEYFRIVREEFKRIAPNKLYMGCRYSTPDPFAVYPAVKYVDVMSFNYYKRDVVGFVDMPSDIDKPVIIGEFHFGALDRGPVNTGVVTVRDQRDRAETYIRYVTSALKDPRFVGVHWHQYFDNVATGRFDGENFQNGWVDVCDTPYAETVEAVRWVGDNMYRIRSED